MATVMVHDRYGGHIKAHKNIITGLIDIETFNGKTGEWDDFSVDSKEESIIKWLKEIFQPIHLEILLKD